MIKSEPDRKRSKDLGIDLKTIKLFEKIAKAVAPPPSHPPCEDVS